MSPVWTLPDIWVDLKEHAFFLGEDVVRHSRKGGVGKVSLEYASRQDVLCS